MAIFVLMPVALIGMAIGLSVGRWLYHPGVSAPICRPSAPALAEARHEGASVLLFGNSQLHDGEWRLGSALPINCARQGLTARAALLLVPVLPDMAPDAILLGFGAVEALRSGEAVDVASFRKDLTSLADALAARWPQARLLLSTVPPMRAELLPADLQSAAVAAEALSDAARAIAIARPGARLLDLSEVLPADAGGLVAEMTHDGVHLMPEAYAIWSAQVTAALH